MLFSKQNLLKNKKLFIFIIAFLSAFNLSAQEKPASLVLKDSFGSDPYGKFAYNDGYIVAAGQIGAGDDNGSRNIDVLLYSNDEFSLQSQFQLPNLLSNVSLYGINDVTYHSGYWIILARGSSGGHLISATISDGNLSIVNNLVIDIASHDSLLVTGDDNNIYTVSNEEGIAVSHFKITSEGRIDNQSKVIFGLAPNEPSYRDYFSASFDSNALYLTSNQDDIPAKLYRLPLDEEGAPQEAVELGFDNAESKYHTSKVSGDLWFLTYHFWGFQVARIENDTLTVIYEFDQNAWYNDIIIRDNDVIAIDTFSSVDTFTIEEDKSITYNSSYSSDGFFGGGHLVDDMLFITRDWNGIEVTQFNTDKSITALNSFSQSGEVTDIAVNGDEVAVSALDSNLFFWRTDNEQPISLESTFHTINDIQGVEWNDEDIVISATGRFESHLVGNLKNNIDLGTEHGLIGSSGRDGQIIKLANGYVAQSFDYLTFFDQTYTRISQIDLAPENNSSNYIQSLVASDNLLFVPLRYPSEIVIYDTSDLANIAELSRISRAGFMEGNVAVKDNFLYVPVSQANGDNAVTPYDITDPTTPQELVSFRVGGSNAHLVLHIENDFLAAIDSVGTLFDITAPETPILIDEISGVSTTGIGYGFGNEIYTVADYSAGHIHRSQINLAPEHADVNINAEEDIQTSLALSPNDNENDSVSYTIVTEPSKGILVIENDETVTYRGASNENGSDSAQLLVTDVHGGASLFDVTIEIAPVNDAPVLESSTVNATEDITANEVILATDIDSESLTFTLVTQAEHGSAQLTEAGELTYLSNTHFNGEDSIEIQVADGDGGVDNKTLTIIVAPINDDPVYSGNISSEANEDTSLSFDLSATDVDGDDISFEIITLPDGWNGDIDEMILTVTPKENDNGDFTIVIGVNDGSTVTQQSLSVSLAPINDAPTYSNDVMSLSATSGQTRNVVIAASDVDGDALTYEISEQATNGTATVDENGTVTYVPNAGYTGADSFTITATDDAGESVSISVNVTVSAPPVVQERSESSGGGSLHHVWLLLLMLSATQRYVVTKRR